MSPTTIIGGVAFPVQPTVVIQDVNGNTVTSDSTTTVVLSIAAGRPLSGGPGTLTCSSGNTLRVTSGVANFGGCSIDKVGTSYALTAGSSPVYTSATSNSFNVSPGAPVKLTFTSQPTTAYANQAFSPATRRRRDRFGR